jgi:DNA-binding PucR family transcriptional regulator
VRTTLAEYLEQASSIEACARNQFVHVNTVRYRLRQVSEATGLDPANPAENLTLRLALMQGRFTGNL